MTIPPSDHERKEIGYIVDPETQEESERLRIQGRYLDKHIGLLPKELPDLARVGSDFRVLDIGCSSGGWACDVANLYRHINVTGIDISSNMIRAAKARVIANQIPHASFEVMDATRYPLPFPDASFDFIHARLICAFMQTKFWPLLLYECYRLLRPGGYFCSVEGDAQCWSSSEALAQFYFIGHQALYQNGNSWEREGVGIVVRLPALLKRAGFDVLPMETQRIDLGYGTEGYKIGVKDYKILLRDIIPFCIKTGVSTKEQLEALYADMLKEIAQPDFNAFWLFTRVLGCKPH